MFAVLAAAAATAAAQSLVGKPFEDVVRYLASPDPKLRVEAMRTLAQTAHPDAIGPIAQLTADPVDDIQLEALDTLLRFYLTRRADRHQARRRRLRDRPQGSGRGGVRDRPVSAAAADRCRTP